MKRARCGALQMGGKQVAASLPMVLVADPDPLYQHQLGKLLEPSFRCIIASSLRKAIQALQRERPVLLVLDVDQPDGDGIELIRRMQSHPDFHGVLIACVTRRSSIKDKMRAFQAGADDYLVSR